MIKWWKYYKQMISLDQTKGRLIHRKLYIFTLLLLLLVLLLFHHCLFRERAHIVSITFHLNEFSLCRDDDRSSKYQLNAIDRANLKRSTPNNEIRLLKWMLEERKMPRTQSEQMNSILPFSRCLIMSCNLITFHFHFDSVTTSMTAPDETLTSDHLPDLYAIIERLLFISLNDSYCYGCFIFGVIRIEWT